MATHLGGGIRPVQMGRLIKIPHHKNGCLFVGYELYLLKYFYNFCTSCLFCPFNGLSLGLDESDIIGVLVPLGSDAQQLIGLVGMGWEVQVKDVGMTTRIQFYFYSFVE